MEIKIIRDTKVNEEVESITEAILPTVEAWLRNEYELEEGFFAGLVVELSCTPGRNLYYIGEGKALIRVSSSRLYLYNIKDMEKTTPPHGIPVGVGAYLSLSIIHEATHYIQERFDRNFSEEETTSNQLAFMEAFYPMDCLLLVKATGVVETQFKGVQDHKQ